MNKTIEKIKERHMQTLYNAHAPFSFVDDKGEVQIYQTLEKAYYDALLRIVVQFQRGYVDLTLYLMKQMELRRVDARSCVEQMLSFTGTEIVLLDFKNWPRNTQDNCEAVIRGLCDINGVEFDKSTFLVAYKKFETNWGAMVR